MKLATVAEVLARMNLTSTVSIQNAGSITSALEAATPMLESLLRTPLVENERVDYFDYTKGIYDPIRTLQLWLTQRFVTGTIEVYLNQTGGPIGDDLAGLTPLETSGYILDRGQGRLTLLSAVNPGNSVVAVKYTAGFVEASLSIPDWLREAAITAAVYINHNESIAHAKKDRVDMSRPLSRQVYSLINEYITTPYGGEHPANSVVL